MGNKDLKKKKKNNERNKEEKKDDREIVTPEELKDFIEDLKDKYNLEDQNIRIVRIERKKPEPKQIILTFLLSYIFDFVLIIALNGYLAFAPYDIWRLLLFSVIFSTTEIIIRELTMKYYPKWMFYSFGLILIPITIIALVFAWWITPGLVTNDTNDLILFFIIFLILRVLINFMMMRRNRDKMFRKIQGGK
ncbi:MAG: hypothetical protein PHX62_01100 [Bacilli bacterium]|nr:hypothetical protein [Bacilli bacterium]